MLDNVDTYPRPTEDRDLMDLAMLAKGMMPLTRCPGGRYTIRNHTVCAHCGTDLFDDPKFCGQPLDEDGFTPFDATVARRIMRDGAGRFE